MPDDAIVRRLVECLGAVPTTRIDDARAKHPDRPLLDALRAEEVLSAPVLDGIEAVARAAEGADAPPERVESSLREAQSDETLPPGAMSELLHTVARNLAAPAPAYRETRVSPASPGRSLGRFRIEAVLGSGGMGIVYRAFDPQLERSVALKVVSRRGNPEEDDDASSRFVREAKAAASLSHPNLVAVFEVGEVGGLPFYTQELIEGTGLDRILLTRHLSPEESLRTVQAAARGLHEAHTRGILHRDVKPGNVIVSADLRTVKVTDFGLARRMQSKGETVTGALLGTPHYMSPEQARGRTEDLDARSDVYGLGCVLYECLTGRRAFPGSDAWDVVESVLKDDPVPPRRVEPRVPEEVEWICLRCLEKDRDRRYASAAALAEDIDRYLTGRPIEARPASVAYRLRKRIRRNPWAWGFAAVACVAAIATLAVLGIQSRRYQSRDRAEGLARQAEVAYAAGNLDETKRRAEDALRIDGSHAGARLWLARLRLRVYLDARGLPLVRIREGWVQLLPPRKESPELGAERESIAASFAGTSAAPLAEGMFLLVDGKCDEALRSLARIGDSVPGAWEARLGEAQALYRLGRFDEAADRLAPQAGLDARIVGPIAGQVAMARGLAAHLKGEEAADWFAQAESMGRRMEAAGLAAEGRKLRARALVAWGRTGFDFGRPPDARYDQAISALEGLSDADADVVRGEALLARAEALAARGRLDPAYPRAFQEAIDSLDTAIRRDAQQPIALLDRAEAFRARWDALVPSGQGDRNDIARAREDYARAVAESPDLLDAAVGLAWAESQLACRKSNDPADWIAAYVEEIRRLTALVEGHPDSPPLLVARANAWRDLAGNHARHGLPSQDDSDSAEADFAMAVQLNPAFAFAHAERGRNRNESAMHLEQHGDDPTRRLQEAIEDFGRALDANPADAESFLDRGVTRRRMAAFKRAHGGDPSEDWARAIEDIDSAIRINALSRRAYVVRGMIRSGRASWLEEHGKDAAGAFEEAIGDFTRALELDGSSWDAALQRASARIDAGDFSERRGVDPLPWYRQAIDDCTLALKAYPTLSNGFVLRGIARGHLAFAASAAGNDPTDLYQAAILDLTHGTELAPDNPQAFLWRGNYRQCLGTARMERGGDPSKDFGAAIDDLTRALAIKRDSSDAYRERGIARSRLAAWRQDNDQGKREDFDLAVADLRRAVELCEQDAVAWRFLGTAQAGVSSFEAAPRGRLEEAVASLDKAIALNPGAWESYEERGLVRLHLDQGKEALADLTRVTEIFPSRKEALASFIEKAKAMSGGAR